MAEARRPLKLCVGGETLGMQAWRRRQPQIGLKIWDIIYPWAVGSLRGSLSTAVPAGALSHHLRPVCLPGHRGMVVVADRTSELYQKTYWASYNIPYVLLPGTPLPLLSSPCRGGVLPW